MSLLFLVGSEDQLSNGMRWCKRFCDAKQMPIAVAVVGTDRKVLLKHTESRITELEVEKAEVRVHSLQNEAGAILEEIKSTGARYVLMMRTSDTDSWQQPVFERSPVVTLWIQGSNEPPTERDHVICALSETQLIANNTCEQLLGLIPSGVLIPESVVPTTEEYSAEHLTCAVDSITNQEFGPEDLICVGVIEAAKNNAAYEFGRKLQSASTPAMIALISDGESIRESVTRSFADRIKNWVASVAPPMERSERQTLVENLEQGSKPNLEFLGLISASAMLAAFGLLQDSAAVVIGAMLIAPLMTPILGAGLSLTHGNRPLFKSSLATIVLGFVGALTASILFGWLVLMVRPTSNDHLDWITSEMWSRCRPSPLDFCVGLVGGLAAAYAQTRKHLSSALAGAAIAAALVPPLSTAGLQVAFGVWDRHAEGVPAGALPIVGPLLLVTVNVLTIMIGASFVLWARGMRSDRKDNSKTKWVPRVVFLLLILTALILVWVVGPDMIFPSDG